jgi:hypothetical protein
MPLPEDPVKRREALDRYAAARKLKRLEDPIESKNRNRIYQERFYHKKPENAQKVIEKTKHQRWKHKRRSVGRHWRTDKRRVYDISSYAGQRSGNIWPGSPIRLLSTIPSENTSVLAAIAILTWGIECGGSGTMSQITIPITAQISTIVTPVSHLTGAVHCPLDTKILPLVRASISIFAMRPDLLQQLQTPRRKGSETE